MSQADSIALRTGEARHQARLISAVLDRLQRRSELASTAREILGGLRSESSLPEAAPYSFFGEKDPITICGPSVPVRHECGATDFDCADKFDCRTPTAFDCGNFSCGAAGGGADSFTCDADFDFICGGEAGFDCAEQFDCSGGHVFYCSDKVDCAGNFGCNGGGTACSESHPYSVPQPGGDIDGTPGDFYCGLAGGDAGDDFDCSGKFNCAAEDDFTCMEEFHCEDFTCSDSTDFTCFARYTGDLDPTAVVQKQQVNQPK